MQTIGITGGTGFIGHHLTDLLLKQGYRIIIYTRDMHKVSRKPNIKYSYLCPAEQKFDLSWFKDLDAVINLAGAGIADKRWTTKRKKEIVDSRVQGTTFLIDKLKSHAPNCKTFISASAIGYYGNDKDEHPPFQENDAAASDFLGTTCKLWEDAAHIATERMRTIILRFGIVLGAENGLFPQLEKPQNFGIVPMLGNGRQTISWIHILDLCRAIERALVDEKMMGIYNAVAPKTATQKEIMKCIAKEKKGIMLPIFVPNILLKIGLGELAAEATKSTTVSAQKILATGFNFQFPEIKLAVKDLLHQRSGASSPTNLSTKVL